VQNPPAKTPYLRILISLASGMCLLLVAGVLIEIFGHLIYKESKHQLIHFGFWVIASIASFVVIKKYERKT
jgi:hypothetical protein